MNAGCIAAGDLEIARPCGTGTNDNCVILRLYVSDVNIDSDIGICDKSLINNYYRSLATFL